MNLIAAPVMLGAALVTAPAAYGAFVLGTTTPETAVVRFLIAAALLWVGLSFVEMLVGPAPRPPATTDENAYPDTVEREAEPAG